MRRHVNVYPGTPEINAGLNFILHGKNHITQPRPVRLPEPVLPSGTHETAAILRQESRPDTGQPGLPVIPVGAQQELDEGIFRRTNGLFHLLQHGVILLPAGINGRNVHQRVGIRRAGRIRNSHHPFHLLEGPAHMDFRLLQHSQ